jgi:hypothetical protein
MFFIMDHSEVYATSLFDPGNLTREELIQVSFLASIQRNNLVAMYYDYQAGIIDQIEWESSRLSVRQYFGHPLGRVMWEPKREYLVSSNREALAFELDEVLASDSVLSNVEWTQVLEELVEAGFE